MTDPPATPVAALDAVTAAADYLRVSTRDLAADVDDWLPSASLVGDPRFLYDTMRAAMDGRGVERDDIGMSLIVQGYAFRIASVTIGTWLAAGRCVDTSPGNVSIRFGGNRPYAVLLDAARWAAGPAPDDEQDRDGDGRAARLAALHRHLVDDHLAPLVDTARAACRVGSRMLWSNVASSCAESFGVFMHLGGPPDHERWARLRDTTDAFFATARPELARGGHVVPIGPVWAWQRSACCLYYQHADGSRCSDCSLNTAAEREARSGRILKDVMP